MERHVRHGQGADEFCEGSADVVGVVGVAGGVGEDVSGFRPVDADEFAPLLLSNMMRTDHVGRVVIEVDDSA